MNGKLQELEIMKVITMVLVVFAHVTRMFAPYGAVEPNCAVTENRL